MRKARAFEPGQQVRQHRAREAFSLSPCVVEVARARAGAIVEVGMEQEVGESHLRIDTLAPAEVALEQCSASARWGAAGARRDVDGDHEPRASLSCRTHGDRQRFIRVLVLDAPDAHGREDAGHCARGAHGHAQVAAPEEHGFLVAAPGGDHDQAALEAFDGRRAQAVVHVVLQPLPADPSTIREWREIEQGQRPAGTRYGVDALGTEACCPEGAEHRSDAGADHQVGLDAGFLEHAHHADMRIPAGAAAAEHQCDARTGLHRCDLRFRQRAVRGGVVEHRAACQATGEQRAGNP